MVQIEKEQLKNYIIDNKLTHLNKDKLEHFYLAIKDIKENNIMGCSAELGVYKGGASYYIFKLLNRLHYAFDTFEGIQNATEIDFLSNGAFSNVNEKKVYELLKDDKIIIVKGLFIGKREPESFCFSHFDGDTYQSCKDFLKYFYPNTVKGGYLFFDDYDFKNALGVTKAIDEFFLNNCDYQKAFVSSHHQFCIKK